MLEIDPYEYTLITKDGTRLEGKSAILGPVTDIPERKQAEQKRIFMASHDLLTSLPNRVAFDERLELVLTHSRQNRLKFALMFLDLNPFKDINDS